MPNERKIAKVAAISLYSFFIMFRQYNTLLSEQSKGVIASIVCSMLFALIPAYVQLQPAMMQSLIQGGESHWLAVQRIFWSALVLLLMIAISKRGHLLKAALADTKMWPRYFLSALLVAPQYWLFVWAPANGETLNLALGYFTMPIVMVVVGRFIYNESLSRLQKFACLFAVLGTLYAYVMAAGISWVVLVVAIGYPLYFIHRKSIPLSTDIGLTVDHLFLTPFMIIGMFYLYPADYIFAMPATTYLYYLGLALIAITPMLLYLYAYSKLTVSMFGLLSYVEPTFIFLVGLMIGDTVATEEIPTYLCIILALLILILDGVKRMKSSRGVKQV